MHNHDKASRRLALGLACLAGFVDATGFLGSNAYFVSFMSGNTTRLAINLAKEPLLALAPILLIIGFLFGVVIGAIVSDRAGTSHKSAVLGLVTSLLIVAGLCEAAGWRHGVIAASVVAMGALNNIFRRDGEVAIALTYMTGAVVRFGQGLAAWLQGKPRRGWLDNAQLWLSMLSGGIAGAWLYLASALHTEWLAAGFAMALFVTTRMIEARNAQLES